MNNRSRHALTAALATSLALLGGISSSTLTAAESRKVVHAQGVTELPAVPKRVAALSLAALDTLDAMDLEVAAVPALPAADSTTRWPEYLLEKYSQDKYAKIAGGGRSMAEGEANPLIERTRALAPDLIIVNNRNTFDTLREVAPAIDLSVSNASFVDSVVQNILTLGTAFGQEKNANQRAYELLASLRVLRESAADQGTGLVLFAVGNRIMPQQLDARFGLIYELIGVRPVLTPTDGAGGLSSGRPPAASTVDENDPAAKAAAEAAQKARQQAEAEYLAAVMAREPDWLFVVDRNAAFGEAKAAEIIAKTPVIANRKAWQQGKVIYLDQDGPWYLMAGGLGLLERSIDRIQAAFDRHAH
jgi:iron complex transport system substrate-binding protein